MSTKSAEPKHFPVLKELENEIDGMQPEERMPTVRALMSRFEVSQVVVERALDELVRRGRIRRTRGSGIYVQGFKIKNKVIGIYTDHEANPNAGSRFLAGLREAARAQGFHVADFGPQDVRDNHEEIFDTLENMGVSGLVTYLSTAQMFRLEGDPDFLRRLQSLEIPIVTSRPLPGIKTDSVVTDYYQAFFALGQQINPSSPEAVIFLGHQGMPSLARMNGLRAALDRDIPFQSEILDQQHKSVAKRYEQLCSKGWKGHLVVGVPSMRADELNVDEAVKSKEVKLSLYLEDNQVLPKGMKANVIVRQSHQMGLAAVDLLLKRLRGDRDEPRHELVTHELKFSK